MLSELYLKTTDPDVQYTDLLKLLGPILVSVVLHTVLYAGFANLVAFVFLGRPLAQATNVRLVIALAVIMLAGFVARVAHVQEIAAAYKGDKARIRAHVDKVFLTWFYLS
jgi:cell division protein FtsW (lipid II flippase)